MPDSWLTFTSVKSEWTGTSVTFDVSERDGVTDVCFTHDGLTPELGCDELCSRAWTGYVAGSLRDLTTTGVGTPNPAS